MMHTQFLPPTVHIVEGWLSCLIRVFCCQCVLEKKHFSFFTLHRQEILAYSVSVSECDLENVVFIM